MTKEHLFSPTTTSTGPARARWMVVDDNDSVRELLARVLGSLRDVEICCFADATDALNALAAEPDAFEFIVTDLEMPGISGIEFCRRVRQRHPQMQILLATGSGLVTYREALDLGFCGLLSKPFPLAVLQRTLAAVGVL